VSRTAVLDSGSNLVDGVGDSEEGASNILFASSLVGSFAIGDSTGYISGSLS